MADLEAVLADVSYLMAMEKSRTQPAARASKKILLPDPRYGNFVVRLHNDVKDIVTVFHGGCHSLELWYFETVDMS